ncbi:hypothetical protein CC86DRAFT_381975 [Ophiobolus disseminans]|uniref:Uncharacterized protein n=1 Tax=Ophiobolus disseminans TaxID=1469910 RepID=A0A6A7A0R7_9PLEO|nr:hypothetical protein CC86DRAFT_381975 [Ophiobolus disseminans]
MSVKKCERRYREIIPKMEEIRGKMDVSSSSSATIPNIPDKFDQAVKTRIKKLQRTAPPELQGHDLDLYAIKKLFWMLDWNYNHNVIEQHLEKIREHCQAICEDENLAKEDLIKDPDGAPDSVFNSR